MTNSKAISPTDASIEWTCNPWLSKGDPFWRRPWVSLTMSIAISVLLGYSMAYPNFPDSFIPELEQMIEAGGNAEEIQAAQTQLDGFLRQQEIWPLQMLGWAGISFALLLAMTATLYLPIRYRFDDKGVTVFFLGTPNFRKWDHYRNFYVHDTGIHLTTMPTPSPLDPFRGHFLRVNNNREAVIGFVKSRIVNEGSAD